MTARAILPRTMAGVVALAVVSAVYSRGLAALREREEAGAARWFGYAQDGVNLAGFLAYSGAFGIAGLAGHVALLAGAALALLAYGLEFLLARGLAIPHVGVAHLLITVLAAAAIGFAIRPIGRGLDALLDGLF